MTKPGAAEVPRSGVYASLAAGVRAAVDWRAEIDGHAADWTQRQRDWLVDDMLEALFGSQRTRRLCVRYIMERENWTERSLTTP